MNRFGSPSTGATHRLLLYQEQPNLESVLDASDFNVELRNRYPYLMEFLISDDALSQLVTIVTTVTTRASHRKFIQLFQGNVGDIFTPFARNLRFARQAFSTLNDPNATYGVGTLSRMFSRAAEERRALDIVELLRVTETDGHGLFHEIVKHFDTGVVHHIALELATDSHPELILLAWYIFRALAGPSHHVARSEWPRAVFLAPEIDLTDIILTPTYRMRAIEWLSAYLPLSFSVIPTVSDFRERVAEWLIQLDWSEFTPALFELAKRLGPNEQLKTRIVQRIRDVTDISEEIASAVDYLGMCPKLLKWWEAAGVVAKVLLKGDLKQTGGFGCIEIVRGWVDAPMEPFVNAIKQIVSAAWNRNISQGGDRLLAGICVSIVAVLGPNPNSQDESLFPSEFLGAWVNAPDRPPELTDYIDIWSQPIRNIANEDFLDKLVGINEIEDGTQGTEEVTQGTEEVIVSSSD